MTEVLLTAHLPFWHPLVLHANRGQAAITTRPRRNQKHPAGAPPKNKHLGPENHPFKEKEETSTKSPILRGFHVNFQACTLRCQTQKLTLAVFTSHTLTLGSFDYYCWWFRNPARRLRLVLYPVIYRFFYISGGAGISAINSIFVLLDVLL